MVGTCKVAPLDRARRALAGIGRDLRHPGVPRAAPPRAAASDADALDAALGATGTGLLRSPGETDDWVLRAPLVQGLMLWGTFNPYAPSIQSIFLAGRQGEGRRLLAWAGLTPFSQRYVLLGALEGDPSRETWVHTSPPLPHTLELACAGELHDGRPLTVDPPSFLMPLSGLHGDDARRAFAALLSRVRGLESALDHLRRHSATPWQRASADFDARLRATVARMSGERDDDRLPSPQTVARYLHLACSAARRDAELEALPQAWAGSIEAASRLLRGVHDTAMPWETVRRHLFTLACGQHRRAGDGSPGVS